ncbi:Hypothetical protein NTJ_09409 [Nesidiocoris tenuis]|uniref:Uncharacterized protein n=1 Tax=Nesidiocoris tenuis TaxID=355587 RepID=A0ABN7AWM8_9HEMI|nr:Hypothetical protein NTJ_09409 [Nesidiocoris tenuis]
MLDGQLANKSEKFVYPSALVGPSKRDERFRKYNVYKYILPSVFERWDLTVLMKESVPVKVKVSYDGLPLYEEVASQKVLRLQWDEVYSAFIGDILLKPKTGENVLPTTFYVGVTLANPVRY